MNTAKRRAFLGGASALAALAHSARAQTAPTRILVGSSPGGGQDMVARMIAEKLNGGPIGAVFVENKPGASGMIAADLLNDVCQHGKAGHDIHRFGHRQRRGKQRSECHANR